MPPPGLDSREYATSASHPALLSYLTDIQSNPLLGENTSDFDPLFDAYIEASLTQIVAEAADYTVNVNTVSEADSQKVTYTEGEDEIIVTAPRNSWWIRAEFLSEYFDTIVYTPPDFAAPDIEIEGLQTCIHIATLPGAGGLNGVHSQVLAQLLDALSNGDVTQTFTDSSGNSVTVSLGEIVGSLVQNEVQITSGNLDVTLDGEFDALTNTITIGTVNIGLPDSLNNIIHEAIHAWAFHSDGRVNQGPDNGTHPAWVAALAAALAQAIQQASPSSFNAGTGTGCDG